MTSFGDHLALVIWQLIHSLSLHSIEGVGVEAKLELDTCQNY